jgi:hypothetical protein
VIQLGQVLEQQTLAVLVGASIFTSTGCGTGHRVFIEA